MSRFADKDAELSAPAPPKCKLCTALAPLTDEERDDLRALFADESKKSSYLHALLEAEGIEVGPDVVRRHRAKHKT